MKNYPLLSNESFCQGFFCGAYLLLGFTTLITKIILPILAANAEGSIWLTYIAWDAWWIVYFILGWKLQFPSKKIWIFSISAALTDFLISGFKLIFFSNNALMDVWRLLHFFNNLYAFILAFLLFFYLFSHSTRKTFGAENLF